MCNSIILLYYGYHVRQKNKQSTCIKVNTILMILQIASSPINIQIYLSHLTFKFIQLNIQIYLNILVFVASNDVFEIHVCKSKSFEIC